MPGMHVVYVEVPAETALRMVWFAYATQRTIHEQAAVMLSEQLDSLALSPGTTPCHSPACLRALRDFGRPRLAPRVRTIPREGMPAAWVASPRRRAAIGLRLELSDETFDGLKRGAAAAHRTMPEHVIAQLGDYMRTLCGVSSRA